MVAMKVEVVLFLMTINVSTCIRRIVSGIPVTAPKPYVVYFVKAPKSPQIYDSWLCGGALVSDLFIITSAACVEDLSYVYAIAGYQKYVPDDKLDANECIKTKKKKVVYTCIPIKYDYVYEKLEKWSFIDIALAKVESPYDFKDESYKKVCSYIPGIISINYDHKYQEPGVEAMVMGWGHREFWKDTGDFNNYNQEVLHYTPTLIMDKEKCKKDYAQFPNMNDVIEQFMICTKDKGNINEVGKNIIKSAKVDSCNPKKPEKLYLESDILCDNDNTEHIENVLDDTRKQINNKTNDSVNKNMSTVDWKDTNGTFRRQGICQNDHGGPLVTWVGRRAVVIGIASVYQVSDSNKCMGPYLYTSTQCNSAFLDCVLNYKENNASTNASRRALCDSDPNEKGFDTLERYISWRNHPDGPADSEKLARKYIDHGNDIGNIRNERHPKLNKTFDDGRIGMVEYIGHDEENDINKKKTKFKMYSRPMFTLRSQLPLTE